MLTEAHGIPVGLAIDGANRHDMKLARERARISMSLAVYGKATVRTNGAETERSVRLYDTLPTWWNRAAADQRAAWLLAYFSKQLHLESGDELLTVRIPI